MYGTIITGSPTGRSAPVPVRRMTVMQGDAQVSSDHDVEMTTVLGSCVAMCLYDGRARVGGMNHFLLAEPRAGCEADVDEHYGVFLMELLINRMIEHGAGKMRMRAHLYGGANLNPGMAPIGTANARFAEQFLDREGIPLLRADLRGTRARRIDFAPASGRVRCRAVAMADRAPLAVMPQRSVQSGQDARGDVEFF